jgi:monofunctional biosynthetic peptidoglycan transglycosylase
VSVLRRRVAVSILGVLLAVAVSVAATWAWLPDPGALGAANPGTTAFIRLKCPDGCPLAWTPLGGISPFLKEAVILGEDAGFLEHGAISWFYLREALRKNLREGRVVWGGSTLTMQLARNLYLSPDRTLRRKFLEVLLAFKIERALPKERILELYLNVAEWAPGVFGVTAASRHYFGKEPRQLGPHEAAFLASILPSPVRAGEPDVRERFSGKGAFIFERLLRSHLPVGQAAAGEPDSCPERLGEDAARTVDGILAALFARFGLEVISGDAARLTLDELQAPLDAEQRGFVDDLLAEMAAGRPPLPCRRGRGGSGEELTAWDQEEGPATVRYWLPDPVLPCFEALRSAAAADGVSLLVRSAYRSPGYQAYLILRELRVQGYCRSAVRARIEAPDSSEHACLDSTAVDFGAPDGSGPAFAQTPAFRWLQENARDFGFRLSYPQDDPNGVGFEPWHWRFAGACSPAPRALR